MVGRRVEDGDVAMASQVEVVRRALGAEGAEVPVHPVLCFVGATWPGLRPRPLSVRGVTILWPKALGDLLTAPSTGRGYDMAAAADRITRALKPA
jgi:hypothetical protein